LNLDAPALHAPRFAPRVPCTNCAARFGHHDWFVAWPPSKVWIADSGVLMFF